MAGAWDRECLVLMPGSSYGREFRMNPKVWDSCQLPSLPTTPPGRDILSQNCRPFLWTPVRWSKINAVACPLLTFISNVKITKGIYPPTTDTYPLIISLITYHWYMWISKETHQMDSQMQCGSWWRRNILMSLRCNLSNKLVPFSAFDLLLSKAKKQSSYKMLSHRQLSKTKKKQLHAAVASKITSPSDRKSQSALGALAVW